MHSGWVTVTGPPAAIWALNSGTTLPALPSTLPKRTTVKRTFERCASSRTMNSARRLEAPIALEGATALSVEMSTKRSTPTSVAIRATVRQPVTLVLIASSGIASMKGTCLRAAAWKTSCGR